MDPTEVRSLLPLSFLCSLTQPGFPLPYNIDEPFHTACIHQIYPSTHEQPITSTPLERSEPSMNEQAKKKTSGRWWSEKRLSKCQRIQRQMEPSRRKRVYDDQAEGGFWKSTHLSKR